MSGSTAGTSSSSANPAEGPTGGPLRAESASAGPGARTPLPTGESPVTRPGLRAVSFPRRSPARVPTRARVAADRTAGTGGGAGEFPVETRTPVRFDEIPDDAGTAFSAGAKSGPGRPGSEGPARESSGSSQVGIRGSRCPPEDREPLPAAGAGAACPAGAAGLPGAEAGRQRRRRRGRRRRVRGATTVRFGRRPRRRSRGRRPHGPRDGAPGMEPARSRRPPSLRAPLRPVRGSGVARSSVVGRRARGRCGRRRRPDARDPAWTSLHARRPPVRDSSGPLSGTIRDPLGQRPGIRPVEFRAFPRPAPRSRESLRALLGRYAS